MNKQQPSTTEQILDLLLDALQERQTARQGKATAGAADAAAKAADATTEAAEAATDVMAEIEAITKAPPPSGKVVKKAPKPPREPRPGEEGWTLPPRLPSINLGRTLGRLLLVLIILVVLANVPVNRYGTSLARIMPDKTALIVRDGLVLKGSGPEIYVLEDNKLRWISSLDAFEYFHYKWEQVHEVDDSFLEEFEKGEPIHVLLKCNQSPHIYALENGKKRWIRDIPTFELQGYVWDDVKMVTCDYLRRLPDGPSIPEDAGPPPQP